MKAAKKLAKRVVKDRSAAVVTFHGAAAWTASGRAQVAEWLREKADDLEMCGLDWNETVRMRFMYWKNRL